MAHFSLAPEGLALTPPPSQPAGRRPAAQGPGKAPAQGGRQRGTVRGACALCGVAGHPGLDEAGPTLTAPRRARSKSRPARARSPSRTSSAMPPLSTQSASWLRANRATRRSKTTRLRSRPRATLVSLDWLRRLASRALRKAAFSRVGGTLACLECGLAYFKRSPAPAFHTATPFGLALGLHWACTESEVILRCRFFA